MTVFQELQTLGQSIWYDNIERRLLENGELQGMILRGEIRGVTSNPSIFHNAIAKSHEYDSALAPMAWAGWKAEEIFNQLAVEDIQAAADLFLPLYHDSAGSDGYVSLEVNPLFAHDAQATIREAKRLWGRVERPNVMIKIPATVEGIQAIRQVIAAGINVNVTLIFSLDRYRQVIDAYFAGLEDRVKNQMPIDQIASVASFFISRVDSKVDPKIENLIQSESLDVEKAKGLLGKAAIANAKLAYQIHLEAVRSKRFLALKASGARVQRPLWASTSTKNPAYRDVVYVESLIGEDTVNTVPPQTLIAFGDHGKAAATLTRELGDAQSVLTSLEILGISMAAITQELEDEGVKSFADAYTALIKTIEERRSAAAGELGRLAAPVARRVRALEKIRASRRMFGADPTLWTEDPAGQKEIRKRLGWLDAPEKAKNLIPELTELFKGCVKDGFTHALLLGMGGSSLAPEVMRLILGLGPQGLDLAILDSTHPDQVRSALKRSEPAATLYLVASKSGSTSEVAAFFDAAWQHAHRRLGKDTAAHFVAITDPGSGLEQLAEARSFRAVMLADPTVGGRYSAFTAFGMTAAAVMGQDLEKLIGRGERMAQQCQPDVPSGRNPGLVLGAIMGEASLRKKDKLTLLVDPALAAIGSWLEQLIAESSGKDGKGIIPIDIEPTAQMRTYRRDRLFVYLRLSGEMDEIAARYRKAGMPVLTLQLRDAYDLGAEFYRWEVATAFACMVLGVNAFDQPDVQDNKTRTQNRINSYRATGSLDEPLPIWENDQAAIYGSPVEGIAEAVTLAQAVSLFLGQVIPGDYLAINAYLPRNDRTLKDLQKVRRHMLRQTRVATTLGFGPRFLHSTGQLHKGGPDSGVFLQITQDPKKDLIIKQEGVSFGVLIRAQALGDLEALLARGRRAIRVHLKSATLKDLLK